MIIRRPMHRTPIALGRRLSLSLVASQQPRPRIMFAVHFKMCFIFAIMMNFLKKKSSYLHRLEEPVIIQISKVCLR